MIGAIVLAAGGSTRFGSPKQLQTIDGESWVRRTARFATEEGCAPVVIVTGSHAEEVARELEDLADVTTLVHRDWRQGIGSSIAQGIRHFYRNPKVTGALLMVCDQVALDGAVLRRLIAAFDDQPLRMVASKYAGTVGIPVIFGRGWFERLAESAGDRGAKSLLLERPEWRVDIDWPAGAFDRDERRRPDR